MSQNEKHIIAYIRNTFITGLLLLIPIFITFWIVSVILKILNNAIPIIGGNSKGYSLIITLVCIFLIGFSAKNLFTKRFLKYFEELVAKLPLVNTVYSSSKQIVNAITLSSNKTAFSKVALVEYPRKGMRTIGFITREKSTGISPQADSLVSIFLPTSPNPTSGYFVMLPPEDIKVLDMTVEQGFKLIMSAGIVTPNSPEGKVS